MNFIKQLQEENAELKNRVGKIETDLRYILGFLHCDKFTGVDSNGERKDWISTGDVCRMIRETLSTH